MAQHRGNRTYLGEPQAIDHGILHTAQAALSSEHRAIFCHIASGVGFVAVALILGITCRKFIRKRKRDDKFRRPYDEPRVYRAGGSITGEIDGEDEE